MDKTNTTQQRQQLDDETLLRAAFASQHTHIADDGFTEHVMRALPRHRHAWSLSNITPRTWSVVLNIIGVVAALWLLVRHDFLGQLWGGVERTCLNVLATLLSFDADEWLVQTMLLVHRLPDLLPTASTLTAMFVTIVALSAIGANELMQRAR